MTDSSSEPRYSPMMCLPKATLTPSGLLQLDVNDGEVELMRRSGMELRHENGGGEPMMTPPPPGEFYSSWVDRNVNVTVTVTTHRIVFMTSNHKEARFLHLLNVQQVTPSGGANLLHWNASYKLVLNTIVCDGGELVLVFRSSSKTSSSQKDRDDMLQFIDKALERRAWETASRLELKKKTQTSTEISKRKVGVDAIMAKNRLRHKEAARLADEALSGDAEQLLSEAAELIGVIQKYVVTLQKTTAATTTSSEDSVEEGSNNSEDAKRLAGMLQDMGMTSALTKEDMSRGAKGKEEYYSMVARQVADFLVPKLQTTGGGILTMTDVFCLFNRARGTNLISPEDLIQAMELTKELKLGISNRIFPSGIMVVQLDSFNDQSMAEKLVEFCNTRQQQQQQQEQQTASLTSLEASRLLHTSALLAHEHLLAAERTGYLCRDTTLETTRFFPNRFNDYTW